MLAQPHARGDETILVSAVNSDDMTISGEQPAKVVATANVTLQAG